MTRRAWLTPDDTAVWCEYGIIIPESLAPMLEGALVLLCAQDNWEGFGDMSPDECAEIFTNAFAELEYACGNFIFDEDGKLILDEEARVIIEG